MSTASAQPGVLPASTRVLFTNNAISGWTGSELYVRDVALELAQRGYLRWSTARS